MNAETKDALRAADVITLRDYFAAAALSGMLADPNVHLGDDRNHYVATLAFEVADAMLKARGQS